jgi:pimeloyl-ACP methyl ester carboxylesterase
MAAYLHYEPTADELAAIQTSCLVTAGADSSDPAAAGHWRYEAAAWLADQLGTRLIELPGAHMAYLERPQEFAQALGALLERLR